MNGMLSAHLYTNRGGRTHNEDCADFAAGPERGLFVLADGLGGHEGGETASRHIVESLLAAWESPPPRTDGKVWLEARIQDANRSLLALQAEQHGQMKSTVAALAVDGDQAAWAAVGDSRLYRLHDGRIEQISRDHSVTYKKYLAGELRRNEINFDEDRSSLLRVVGDENRCLPESGAWQLNGDEAMLLCSDGFWEYLYEEEILIDYLKADSAGDWAERMLVRLLPRLRPDSDNLTLLTVFAGGEVAP